MHTIDATVQLRELQGVPANPYRVYELYHHTLSSDQFDRSECPVLADDDSGEFSDDPGGFSDDDDDGGGGDDGGAEQHAMYMPRYATFK